MSRAPYALVAALSLASAGAAQSPAPSAAQPRMKEETPGLLARAAIPPDSARVVTLARVPNGRIAEQEIETEQGKLAYSFDITVPGRPGIEEVLVDARTGAVLAHEHDGPKQEAAERANEAKASRRTRLR